MRSELERIPGVGKKTAADLNALGIARVADLAGKDPQALYALDCARRGPVDRCQLYVYRCAVYFAEHERPDPEKCKWWYWTSRPYPEA